MSTKPVIVPSSDATISRRGFFMKLGILFNGFAAMVVRCRLCDFFFRPLRAVVRTAISPGCRLAASTSFLRARRGWLPFGIPT